MDHIPPHKIKTGGDPRTLPDYAALRDELSKLTHPARPDVNWRYAEKRCLSLFEQNGVELQTLRVLSQNPAGEPLPAAVRAQLEMHLKQLIARYAEIKQDALK